MERAPGPINAPACGIRTGNEQLSQVGYPGNIQSTAALNQTPREE
jgi:hypothetical protein